MSVGHDPAQATQEEDELICRKTTVCFSIYVFPFVLVKNNWTPNSHCLKVGQAHKQNIQMSVKELIHHISITVALPKIRILL